MAKRKGINAKAWFYSQSFHLNVEFQPSAELCQTIKDRDAAFAELQAKPADVTIYYAVTGRHTDGLYHELLCQSRNGETFKQERTGVTYRSFDVARREIEGKNKGLAELYPCL